MTIIKPMGSCKVDIVEGVVSTGKLSIEGWLSFDYDKYLSGLPILDCLISHNQAICNFPLEGSREAVSD